MPEEHFQDTKKENLRIPPRTTFNLNEYYIWFGNTLQDTGQEQECLEKGQE